MIHTGKCQRSAEPITLPQALNFVNHSQHQRNVRLKDLNCKRIRMFCVYNGPLMGVSTWINLNFFHSLF
jgi:hypothetical protein